MIHSAPQSTYSGSQAPLSQVWLRTAAGTAVVPGVKFFTITGQQAASARLAATAVDLVVGTTPKSLAALFDEAMVLAGAPERWASDPSLQRVVGCVSEPITGAGVLAARGIPNAGLFPASAEVFAAGRRFRHGPVPEEGVGGVAEVLGSLSVSVGDSTRQEDSPHASGDRGMFILGVRQDVPGSLVDASGDYAPLQVGAHGRLRTSGAHETLRITGLLDAAAPTLTAGSASGFGGLLYGCDSGSGTVLVEGSNDGATWTALNTWPVNSVSPTLASASQTISPVITRAATIAGWSQVRLNRASGSCAAWMVLTGAQAVPQAFIQSGAMLVAFNGIGSHDLAVGANVLLVGLDARSADPAAVQSGDAVRALATLSGKQVVLPGALPGQIVRGMASLSSTSDAVLLPGAAGQRQYLTTLVVSNPTGTNTEVVIKDGAAEAMRIPAPRDSGGAVVSLPVPLRGGSGAAISAALASAPSGTVTVTAAGYTAGE